MVVKAQLLYGVHLFGFTQAHRKRLSAFQFKGLHKILGLKTTDMDRTNSNVKVFRLANEAIRRETRQATRAKHAIRNSEGMKPAGSVRRKPVIVDDHLRYVHSHPPQTHH